MIRNSLLWIASTLNECKEPTQDKKKNHHVSLLLPHNDFHHCEEDIQAHFNSTQGYILTTLPLDYLLNCEQTILFRFNSISSPNVSGSSRSLLEESSSVSRFFSRPSSSGRFISWLKDTSSSCSLSKRPSCEGRVSSLFPSKLRQRRATRPPTSAGRLIRRLWQRRSSER